MRKRDLSDTNSGQQSGPDSSSEESVPEAPTNGVKQKNEYERQRAKRIEENRARMATLGLPKMATSLMMSGKRRGKTRKDDDNDDEYMPFVEDSDEDDDEWPASRTPKGKKKNLTTKKKVQVQKLKSNSDFVDEDEAFMQALAQSIQDKVYKRNEGCSGPSGCLDPRLTSGKSSESKGKIRIQEESGRRKRKKQVSNCLQMTEDELILHFFQFDEAGKGAISVKDVELVAAAHDFLWTDKELADMIYCFDTDGDGKLSLDDFRKIVSRCNMIQSSELSCN